MKEFAGGPQYTLVGQVMVTLPPEEAFSLFTPRGEELWVRGWEPRFPLPVDDDTVPGTVFETRAHGETTIWVVIDREEGRRLSYARVTPGKRAGTVTVTVVGNGRGGSTVEVTYQLTALSPDGERELNEFAGEYQDFLKSWEEAIAEHAIPSPDELPGT